ncbi:hypothetical protein D3C77_591100 [compost metagenome]
MYREVVLPPFNKRILLGQLGAQFVNGHLMRLIQPGSRSQSHVGLMLVAPQPLNLASIGRGLALLASVAVIVMASTGAVIAVWVNEVGLAALGVYLAVALDLGDQFKRHRWRHCHAVVVECYTVVLIAFRRCSERLQL